MEKNSEYRMSNLEFRSGKIGMGALLFMFVCLGVVSSVSGEIVTLEGRGVVNNIAENNINLDDSVNIGTEIVSRCTYDTNTPDLDPSEWRGEYSLISLSITIGNYTFSHIPTSPEPAMFVIYAWDYCYYIGSDASQFDGIVVADGITPLNSEANWSRRYIRPFDMRSGWNKYDLPDDLPTSAPPLDAFGWTEFEVSYKHGDMVGNFGISGEITSLEVVDFGPGLHHIDAVDGNDNNDGSSRETAFATIGRGIDAAENGDTVLVWPGVYGEEIDFLGKAITVTSAADAAVIAGVDQWSDAVSFYQDEEANSVLKNFVIRDCYAGVFVRHGSPTISNITFVNNLYGVEASGGCEPNISNCIFWDNLEDDLLGCTASFSCIETGGNKILGNIDSDPLFVDANAGDYHLLSERGRYLPAIDMFVLDDVTSRCIDAGDPNAGYEDERTPNGGRINMGAYGGTAHASMNEGKYLDGDINKDGIVNMLDFAMFAENWLRIYTIYPEVTITSPKNGDELVIINDQTTFLVEADAADADGEVVKVQFFMDDILIGVDEDGSDGWTISWVPNSSGEHSLTAAAIDNDGAETVSEPVVISIDPGPGDPPVL
ncbi:Ig-like domain-containing protein [Planctomycetota bacterium]